MKKEPLVSIIIPCYNYEKYVEKSIESALAQTYKNIEIIIIDDGSTDETPHILEKYCNYGNIVLLAHPEHQNRGVSKSRQLGVQQAQGKLVRVIYGDIYDVVVDLRRSSPTFGQWVGVNLSAENKHQLWIPPGFAHGFYVLSEYAEVLYKATDYYAPEWERMLLWNDPKLGVQWPLIEGLSPILSEKDAHGTLLADAECFE